MKTSRCPICKQELKDNDSKFTVYHHRQLVDVHFRCVQKVMNSVINARPLEELRISLCDSCKHMKHHIDFYSEHCVNCYDEETGAFRHYEWGVEIEE